MKNKKLIINADDFGLSDGVCRAIVELFYKNAISSTTIMICSEGAIDRVKNWSKDIVGKAGVHLQLSGGNSISPAKEVKSLVKYGSKKFLLRENIFKPNPKEVELEWTRQIELCAELLGETPTHLDSHRGVHRIDECVDVYIDLAKKYNIPVRGGVSDKLNSSIKSGEIKGSVNMIRDWTGKGKSVNDLLEILKNKKDYLIEVVTHPGYSDEYLVNKSGLNKERENDMNVLLQLKDDELLNKINYSLANHKIFESDAIK